jgi:hypothetical protein
VNNDPNIIIENELLRRGFTSIPNYIFGLQISSNAKLIYMALLSYAWTNQSCYPGLATLCRDVSLSDKPVTKAITELCEASLLEVKRRGQGKTNLYILKEFETSEVQNRSFSDSRIGAQNRSFSDSRIGETPKLKPEKLRFSKDKRKEKDLEEKDTLTNKHARRVSVGVGSKFSLEVCRRYGEHLRKKGEGITNPGGYATAIYRTGEADALIEQFLNCQPRDADDVSRCPDCRGMGFIYPQGVEKGLVAKCKHPRLKTTLKILENLNQLRQLHAADSNYNFVDLREELISQFQHEGIIWDEEIIKALSDS